MESRKEEANMKSTATLPKMSERQLKKLQALRSVAGSIKTDYEVDVVVEMNELRGKQSDDREEI